MKARLAPILCLLVAVALLAPGCAWIKKQTQSEPAAAEAKGAPAAPVGRYYDFDDVQIPVQLKLNTEQSILFRVGSFKAGVLVFEGNVDIESLTNYFVDTMAKDNWALKGTFKYPQAALFFAKKGKTCVIHVSEGALSTKVEIWVAPTL